MVSSDLIFSDCFVKNYPKIYFFCIGHLTDDLFVVLQKFELKFIETPDSHEECNLFNHPPKPSLNRLKEGELLITSGF